MPAAKSSDRDPLIKRSGRWPASTTIDYLSWITPFPHTKAYDDLKQQDRIFSYDWNDYSADKVVYHPKQMSAEKLQQLLHYAWDTFYQEESQELKMFKLFQRVIEKEMANNTFRPRNRALASRAFGKKA